MDQCEYIHGNVFDTELTDCHGLQIYSLLADEHGIGEQQRRRHLKKASDSLSLASTVLGPSDDLVCDALDDDAIVAPSVPSADGVTCANSSLFVSNVAIVVVKELREKLFRRKEEVQELLTLKEYSTGRHSYLFICVLP